jgi:molybdenum cofactor guanylyltransferase
MVRADLTAFILAGGQSTRMGTDKAYLEFGGRTLLDRALQLARSVTPDTRIVGNAAKFSPYAPVVEDVFPNCGPLGGIHAALTVSATDLNLILPVDLPFLTAEFLAFLVSRARAGSASVTLARTSRGWQPLCALYRRCFAEEAEKALRAGRFKIDALFASLKVEAIEEADLRRNGFSSSLFRNLNTPEDVNSAREEHSEA